MKVRIRKVSGELSHFMIEVSPEEIMTMVVAPTVGDLRKMAAGPGFYDNRDLEEDAVFAKGILAAFATAGLDDQQAEDFIKRIINGEGEDLPDA